MIKPIVKDHFILSQKSKEASKDDLYIVQDLLDTIKAHQESCVGMAANMIGYLKRIIVVFNHDDYLIMINPVFMKCSGKEYRICERCLSHDGEKETKRYYRIKVAYYDINMKKKIKTFDGFTAQIIQHEMDHLEGILI